MSCSPATGARVSYARMPTRVLVLGLDAADVALLRKGVEDGTLPTFARLFADAPELQLDNTLSTLPGAIWPEIATGRSSGATGFYFPPRQLRTGEAVPRPVEAHEVDPTAFWTLASDASARVAVFDYPWWPLKPGLNGIHVAEWGTHDRPFGAEGLAFSEPPQLASALTARYGAYPLSEAGVTGSATRAPCDQHDASPAAYEALLADLLAGIELKTQILIDLLHQEEWDLFVTVFGEPQCVGHQMWHLREQSALHPSRTDPVREVYRRLDRAAAALIEAAGAGAVSVVIANHGMAEPKGGPQLIPEVLLRLGLGSGRGATAGLRNRLPAPARKLARLLLRGNLQEKAREAAGSLAHPLASAGTLAAALDGDRCSWIRINVEGREPFGTVSPGRASELVEEIRRALLELTDPRTGQPIVASAATAGEEFGAAAHPDVPDLMVSFREDLGVIEACESARVGRVHVPYHPPAQRTGAHPTTRTTAWIVGLPSEGVSRTGTVRDLAPTILDLLGVSPPAALDGRSLLRRTAVI
jgi:predicted AlkP superfamily phosphohydrolase/phosphomutase